MIFPDVRLGVAVRRLLTRDERGESRPISLKAPGPWKIVRARAPSSCLRSVKLAPAVRTDWVGHDFARGRRHKLNAGRAFLVVFWGILILGYFVS